MFNLHYGKVCVCVGALSCRKRFGQKKNSLLSEHTAVAAPAPDKCKVTPLHLLHLYLLLACTFNVFHILLLKPYSLPLCLICSSLFSVFKSSSHFLSVSLPPFLSYPFCFSATLSPSNLCLSPHTGCCHHKEVHPQKDHSRLPLQWGEWRVYLLPPLLILLAGQDEGPQPPQSARLPRGRWGW